MRNSQNQYLVDIQETNGNVIGVVLDCLLQRSLSDKLRSTLELAKRYPLADDFIWIKKIEGGVYAMELVSPKGELGEMCGNGAVCVLKSLRQRDSSIQRIKLLTRAGIKSVQYAAGRYTAEIGAVHIVKEKMTIAEGVTGYSVNVGEPHVVLVYNEINKKFDELTQTFIIHNQVRTVFPEGINFNLVTAVDGQTIRVETFERGCQRKTKACGTGSVAAVAAFQSLGLLLPGGARVVTEGGIFSVGENAGVYSLIAV